MKNPAPSLVSLPSAAAKTGEPSLPALLFIFWGTFAAAIIAFHVIDPEIFIRQDPDSILRVVQVRDLLAGQGWFDLVQHRLDPPAGALMHWSRLIDAPIAGLGLIGNLFGAGEAFALTAWPLLLLGGLMAGAVSVGTALAGRGAAPAVLILSLFFFSPLLSYLPNSVDHHNAQLVLLVTMLGFALRLRSRPYFGLLAGLCAALSLAVGLEMVPYVAVLGAGLALQWALSGEGSRGIVLFGLSFAVAPAVLHLASSSPAAAWACDSLSWSYVIPAAVAGAGLAVLVPLTEARGAAMRVVGLAGLGAAMAGVFVSVAPACLAGPYGLVTPELKALWLDNITEAQPVHRFFMFQPVGIVATASAPAIALVVACRLALRADAAARHLWMLCAAMIAAPLFLCFYQVRTIPYANAIAIPVLGAWLLLVAQRHGITSIRPLRRSLPLIAAFLLVVPLVHAALGWGAREALGLASGGRIVPLTRSGPPPEMIAGMTPAEIDCLDAPSAGLLAQVPAGLVMAPVFYGSTVLNLSGHSVVAAPYHRQGDAILAGFQTIRGTPDEARAILRSRGVDYLAICTTAREAAAAKNRRPDGLLAQLLAGESFAWLTPVIPERPTALRLWRVHNEG